MYIKRSQVYGYLGEFNKVLVDAQMSVQIQPSVDSYISQGNALYMLKRFDEAIKAFSYGLGLDPRNQSIKVCLDKMIVDCKKAIEHGKDSIEKAFITTLKIYMNWKQAREFYEKSKSPFRSPEIKTLLSEIKMRINEEEAETENELREFNSISI